MSVQLKQVHAKVDHLHLVNSYGLFRRMTGAEGRPEVIIEGSDSIEGPWKEYEFLYKPGNINNSLPFVGRIQIRHIYLFIQMYSIHDFYALFRKATSSRCLDKQL